MHLLIKEEQMQSNFNNDLKAALIDYNIGNSVI